MMFSAHRLVSARKLGLLDVNQSGGHTISVAVVASFVKLSSPAHQQVHTIASAKQQLELQTLIVTENACSTGHHQQTYLSTVHL